MTLLDCGFDTYPKGLVEEGGFGDMFPNVTHVPVGRQCWMASRRRCTGKAGGALDGRHAVTGERLTVGMPSGGMLDGRPAVRGKVDGWHAVRRKG